MGGEVNLVNFVDLFRRARTKQRSRGRQETGPDSRSDIRRRRRIKIKKDPGARSRGEINGSRNQIDTSEQSKREQNNLSHNIFFKTRTRSKARNLIQLPETERKATILDRRTNPQHQPRFSGFRTRKRIPLKFGRSFNQDDKPSDQLIRLRNPEIITKLERSGHNERQVIKTRDRSQDDLDDKMSVKQPEDDPIPEAQHVTSALEESVDEETSPILTTEQPPSSGFIRLTTTSPNKPSPADIQTPEHNAVVDSDAVMNKGSESLELIRKVNLPLPPPPPSISTTATTAKTTTSPQQDDVDLVRSASSEPLSNERAGESSLSPTIAPLKITTTASATTTSTAETSSTTPVMMYPEVFTQLPLDIKTYQARAPVPLSLLSVFGSQPRSSRLQVAASASPGPRIEVSWSQSQSEAVSRSEVVSVFSGSHSPTASSPGLKFSIISTTTQRPTTISETTATLKTEDVTDHVTDYPMNLPKNNQVFPSVQSAPRGASSSTKSTTISLATTTTGFVTEEVTETTIESDETTESGLRDTELKTLWQNESKSQEVTTVRSITSDNRMMTTPIPQDLQLSESITP